MSAQHTPGPLGGLLGEKYGWTVRRARKQHHCRFCYAPKLVPGEHGGTYHVQPEHRIKAGDLCVEGDVDPYEAGGFGHERICLACIDKWEASEATEATGTTS